MIIRPDGLVTVKFNLEFNSQKFEFLEVDLSHINQRQRSKLSIDDVKKLVLCFINNNYVMPSDEKEFGEEYCSYLLKWISMKRRIIV